MRFSPLLVSSLIIKPLRYFFSTYTAAEGLVYSKDDNTRTIEVDTENNFNNVKLESNPRILINRGDYNIGKTGLTDNLSYSKSVGATLGASQRTNLVFINGVARITIEARQEGT